MSFSQAGSSASSSVIVAGVALARAVAVLFIEVGCHYTHTRVRLGGARLGSAARLIGVYLLGYNHPSCYRAAYHLWVGALSLFRLW